MGIFTNPLLRGVLAWSLLMFLLRVAPVEAQDSGTDLYRPPTHVRTVDGNASLLRDGEREPLTIGMPIVEGDAVSTSAGRVELQTNGGTVLDLDEFSTVETLGSRSFRIREGRVALVAASDDALAREGYRLETRDGLITTKGPGEYLVAAGDRATDAVERFARWMDDRRRERAEAAVSQQHLPSELRPYADAFDHYGEWTVEPGYGDVWAPRVEATWQPFYVGYWSLVTPYGWTWISGDPWGWPTHHYGRWHYLHRRWVWSSGRDWSPAWVTWGTSANYVSWGPIGIRSPWASRYADMSFAASPGWVVVPHEYFHTRRALVPRYAVAPRVLDRREAFIEHGRAPIGAVMAAGTNRERHVAVGQTGPAPFVRADRSGIEPRPAAERQRVPDRRPPSTKDGTGRPNRPAPFVSSAPASPNVEPRSSAGQRRADAPSVPFAPMPDRVPRHPEPTRGQNDRGPSAPMRQPPVSGGGGAGAARVPYTRPAESPRPAESRGGHEARESSGSNGHGAVRRSGR